MNALEVIHSNLIEVSGPAGDGTGGTSIGDSNAGTHSSSIQAPADGTTTADRAGAGSLTAIVQMGMIGGSVWMV